MAEKDSKEKDAKTATHPPAGTAARAGEPETPEAEPPWKKALEEKEKTGVMPAWVTGNPLWTSSWEWAWYASPPTPTPLTSKQVDIHPRIPFMPDNNFLDINQPVWGEMLAGLPGMLADKGENNKISAVPMTDIPFGRFVAHAQPYQGFGAPPLNAPFSGEGYCKLAGTGDDRILGIAMRSMTGSAGVINTMTGQPMFEGYRAYEGSVTIVRQGRVWARINPAGRPVSAGQAIGYDNNGWPVSGSSFGPGPPQPGYAVSGGIWISSAPPGGLAIMEINIVSAGRGLHTMGPWS